MHKLNVTFLFEITILFRIWLYLNQRKWNGVIDIRRQVKGSWIDTNEALIYEDQYQVLRLKPRERGKDIPSKWFSLIETSLLVPISTKAIKPWLGHIFGSGKLCQVADLKFSIKKFIIKDLKVISPVEYAEVSLLVSKEEGIPNSYQEYRKVFLCHSSKDKPFVKKLAEELSENGIRVWVDYEQILPGQDFTKRMEDGISECDFVIVVLTPNFLNGPWAQRERVKEVRA